MKETLQQRRDRLKAEQDEQKRRDNVFAKLKQKVRSDISQSGLMSVHYKLELIVNSPKLAPESELGYNEVVRAYNEAIDQYLDLQKTKEE